VGSTPQIASIPPVSDTDSILKAIKARRDMRLGIEKSTGRPSCDIVLLGSSEENRDTVLKKDTDSLCL